MIAIALILTAILGLDKARQALDELRAARASVVVQTARDLIAETASPESNLSGLKGAEEVVDWVASRDPALLGLSVYDANWRSLHTAGSPSPPPGADDRAFGNIPGDRALHAFERGGKFFQYAPILTPSGTVTGWVEAQYSTAEHDRRLAEMRIDLAWAILLLILLAVMCGAIVVRRAKLSAAPDMARLQISLQLAMPVAMAILLVVIFVLFDRDLLMAARENADVLASLIRGELERAALDRKNIWPFPGVDALFRTMISEHAEIGGIQIPGTLGVGQFDGPVLSRVPVQIADGPAMMLQLHESLRYVHGHLLAMITDLLVVLFVAMFAAREIMLFGVRDRRASDGQALQSADAAIEAIRFPIFLFFLGVELSRSFFPLFVSGLYDPALPVSRDIAIAVPMSAWVLAMVLFTPLAGNLTRRHGVRRTIVLGMVPAAAGLFLTATSQGIWELIAWRSLTAAGFGIVTVGALLHIAAHSRLGAHTRSIGVFVAASVAASVCAAAIGGILADRIGQRPTFVIGGTLVLLALLVAHLQLKSTPAGTKRKSPGMAWLATLKEPAFILFVLLAAIPSRVVLTGLFYLLVPLSLHALGYSSSDTGRLMMLFFITMLLLIPVTGRIADLSGRHRVVIIAGAFSAAIGAGLLVLGQTQTGMVQVVTFVAAVAAVGAAQCTARAPMISYLNKGFPRAAERYGHDNLLVAFRVLERAGSVAGPLVVAGLNQAFGFTGSAAALAVWLLASALALSILLLLHPPEG